MRILVIEDEVIFANTLEIMLDEMGYELIEITDNSEEFMRLFVVTKPDLVLLDINVRGSMDGIELAQKIQESTFMVPCIFMTAFDSPEIFSRAKKTNPYAYITKPFTEQQLQYAIELAFHNFTTTGYAMTGGFKDILVRDSFFVKTENKLIKLVIKEVICVEAQDKYCEIYTKRVRHLVRISLREIEEKLPPTDFIRIYRSIIVNANYIENIDLKDNFVWLSNQQKYPISKRYREILLNKLNLL